MQGVEIVIFSYATKSTHNSNYGFPPRHDLSEDWSTDFDSVRARQLWGRTHRELLTRMAERAQHEANKVTFFRKYCHVSLWFCRFCDFADIKWISYLMSHFAEKTVICCSENSVIVDDRNGHLCTRHVNGPIVVATIGFAPLNLHRMLSAKYLIIFI